MAEPHDDASIGVQACTESDADGAGEVPEELEAIIGRLTRGCVPSLISAP